MEMKNGTGVFHYRLKVSDPTDNEILFEGVGHDFLKLLSDALEAVNEFVANEKYQPIGTIEPTAEIKYTLTNSDQQ